MTDQQFTPRPPAWAEAILRLALKTHDRETVSGDLLEEYRDAIVPVRGKRAADTWYVRQTAGFVMRAVWPWALMFSAAFVARQAWDFLVPTRDFFFRSQLTTYTAAAILACTSFWAAWRSGSFVAGILVTVAMTEIAAVLSVAGVSALLAIWHDPATMRNIAGSGGLEEAYVLPFMAAIPAVIIGTVGGAIGSVGRRLLRLRKYEV